MVTPKTPFYPMTHDDAERCAVALEKIAIAHYGYDVDSFPQIQKIVQDGKAQDYFQIGDQIITTWKPDANTVYEMPWDVVDFGPAVDEDGETHTNVMWLQSHYELPGVQFSGNNAFYVPAAKLNPGTYYFTIGNNWGNNCVAGKIYEFILTKEVPAGGQLVLGTASSNTSRLSDTSPANWRVRTYSNGFQNTPTEIVALTEVESSDGSDLGVLSSSTKFATSGINNMQRSAYGYNRWSVSAIRQWLNSAADAEGWWTQQYPHDHRPDQLSTMRGFEAGLPADFIAIIKPVKMVTALNTVSDSEIGTSEETIDRFFLPSLQQEFIAPQLADVEGTRFEYWYERLGGVQHAQGGTRPEHIRYAIENHTSAQYVRLRSAFRGNAYSTWYVHYSGGAGGSNGYATYAHRPVPVCAIY